MQHYSRDVVEVSEWCRKCKKFTMHRVNPPKLGSCLVCLKKLNETKTAAPAAKPEPQQFDLFGKA